MLHVSGIKLNRLIHQILNNVCPLQPIKNVHATGTLKFNQQLFDFIRCKKLFELSNAHRLHCEDDRRQQSPLTEVAL